MLVDITGIYTNLYLLHIIIASEIKLKLKEKPKHTH